MLAVKDFPQLKLIAWNRGEDAVVDEEEAFALYERNWRYVDKEKLLPQEKELIERLTQKFGHGFMNV